MSKSDKHVRKPSSFALDKASTNVAAAQMRNALNKLADTVPKPERAAFEQEMDNFFALYQRYLSSTVRGDKLAWDRVQTPNPEQVVDYRGIPKTQGKPEHLDKLAVLKLNGGLGTSMGCVGPKSVIEVRDGKSFLDLMVRQIEHLNRTYEADVPFILMNSFNTDADTETIIEKYKGHSINIKTFNQSRFPRINKDTLLPLPESASDDNDAWYPPGHGDLFESLSRSGILDDLIAQGKEVLFVSNGDNLGATVDFDILKYIIDSGSEYIMELTDKTRADVKGGTLIDYDGQVQLLELAQVPKEHVEEFKSIKKFKYFNTNNLWINLKAMKRLVDNDELEMEIIPNPKTIKHGSMDLNVLQLETAVGAAIRHFKNARGVNVPRSRFLPVKTCSDLFLVKSDLYYIEHGSLVMDSRRFGGAPLIKLGGHFKKVGDFQKRIAQIPKIIELDHLTVTGNVTFGKGIELKGTVIVVCEEGNKIQIPNGAVLENVVITGSLSILEH